MPKNFFIRRCCLIHLKNSSTCHRHLYRSAKMLRKTGTRLKGDQRILGESGFVEQVLSAANELMNRRYQLRAKGFTCSEIDENTE